MVRITLTSTHFRNLFSGKEGDLPIGFPDRFNSSFFVFCDLLRRPFPRRNWRDSRVCRKTPYNPTVSDNCWCPISAWWPVSRIKHLTMFTNEKYMPFFSIWAPFMLSLMFLFCHFLFRLGYVQIDYIGVPSLVKYEITRLL